MGKWLENSLSLFVCLFVLHEHKNCSYFVFYLRETGIVWTFFFFINIYWIILDNRFSFVLVRWIYFWWRLCEVFLLSFSWNDWEFWIGLSWNGWNFLVLGDPLIKTIDLKDLLDIPGFINVINNSLMLLEIFARFEKL